MDIIYLELKHVVMVISHMNKKTPLDIFLKKEIVLKGVFFNNDLNSVMSNKNVLMLGHVV